MIKKFVIFILNLSFVVGFAFTAGDTYDAGSLVENTSINFSDIKQQSGSWKDPFSLTANKPGIDPSDITEKIGPKKYIDNQPSFIDIAYLQLNLISDLSDSLINTKNNFNFSSLFKTSGDYINYNTWIKKFGKYTRKKDFIDAFSGAITLKDIGIAQDIIYGLYNCANNDRLCSNIIKFTKNPIDKYETYSLDNIQNLLYLKTSDNILENAINYYNTISLTCSNLSTITDSFLKYQTQNICNNILKQNVDYTDESDFEDYNLGYVIGQRVNNLNTLKDNFKNLGTGVNLLGIYNLYYELTYLNIGLNKLSYIEKTKKETNSDNQYEVIKKIFEKEEKNINKKIIEDNVCGKRKAKIKTIIKLFNKKNNRMIQLFCVNCNILKDINIQSVNGNCVSNIIGNNIFSYNIAYDIMGLGWGHGISSNNTIDSRELPISFGSDFAGKKITLKFNVKVFEYGTDTWNNCCEGLNNCVEQWYSDYIKIYIGEKKIIKKCYNGNGSHDESIDNIELDSNGKVTIKFETYTTSIFEYADITNIIYNIDE